MGIQQTFKQTIKSIGYAPITREQIAEALERIALDLRMPFRPDPNGHWNSSITFNQRFEINGQCWLGNTPEEGYIHLVVQ